MATWTIQAGESNPEGTLISFLVRATAEVVDEIRLTDRALPDDTNDEFDLSKFGDLHGWFVPEPGEAPSAMTLDAALTGPDRYSPLAYGFTLPATDGGGNVYIEFMLGLRPNAVRVAMNNDSRTGEHYLEAFAADWVNLMLKRVGVPNPVPIAAKAIAPTTDFSGLRVGKLPSSGAHPLKLQLCTEAQWVKSGGAVTNLNPWDAYAGAESFTGAGANIPDLAATLTNEPVLSFDGASSNPGRYFSDSTPPVLQDTATIAAVFDPSTTNAIATIVGRYNLSPSWRLYYKGDVSPPKVVYQARSTGGTVESEEIPLETEDTVILATVERDGGGSLNLIGRINGRFAAVATAINSVDAGDRRLSIGAREVTSINNWVEALAGQINHIGLYSTRVNELELSLINHEMALRAKIDLGTPIPAGYQTQPYTVTNPEPDRRLDRRPIAVIGLYTGRYNDNVFGQSTANWYGLTQAQIESRLRDSIREVLTGCDQFEIMFNRAGGKFNEDIVAAYIFDGSGMVTTTQWDAMRAVWDDCGWNGYQLSDHNDDANKLKRGWFYTGGGLPLNDDGTLDTSGHMGDRVVAPATPKVYRESLLEEWTAIDDRFRCFFLDAAVQFFGKLPEMTHEGGSNGIRENYILVGEAIPQSGIEDDQPTQPQAYAARFGAPWFALASAPNGPWWGLNADDRTDIRQGYNIRWSAAPPGVPVGEAWTTTPIYFGVQRGGYLNLTLLDEDQDDGYGSNMPLGDIYRWTLHKGATPVAWQGEYAKVGAAWDYATGRILASRLADTTRILRFARV